MGLELQGHKLLYSCSLTLKAFLVLQGPRALFVSWFFFAALLHCQVPHTGLVPSIKFLLLTVGAPLYAGHKFEHPGVERTCFIALPATEVGGLPV